MIAINRHLADTASPPVPEVEGWAAAYEGRFGTFVDLAQAVPGYPPHAELLQRLGVAARDPRTTRYGPILGDSALREAYAAHLSEVYGAALAPRQTVITSGCNQAFFVTVLALAASGDNIVLPVPWYFNHKMTLDMLGIEVRPLPCAARNAFVPDPADLEALVDGRTRAVVLVSPNNPTGAVYPPEVIASFAEACRAKGVWLIIDETYRDFLPAEGPPHHLFADPDWSGTAVSLYSFSKAYCMPGHRMGAIAVGEELARQIGKVLDCVQICPPRAPQAVLPWALAALRSWRAGNRREIAARAAAFAAMVHGLEGWQASAMGSYFAYIEHPFAQVPARTVAQELARIGGVLALPGSYFGPGQEQFLRIAFANAEQDRLAALGERLAALTPQQVG